MKMGRTHVGVKMEERARFLTVDRTGWWDCKRNFAVVGCAYGWYSRKVIEYGIYTMHPYSTPIYGVSERSILYFVLFYWFLFRKI